MFGMSKGKSGGKGADQEAQARKIEALKQSLTGSIEQMAPFVEAGNTDKCEAVVERLKTSLKNPILPRDFTKETLVRLDILVRDSFMKSADIAVGEAQRAAMRDDRDTRDKKIKIAREKLAGAVRMKAPPEFKMSCERAIETASLSGGIKKDGPTKAKPADFAPKNKNQAKPDEAYYKAIADEEAAAEKAAAEMRAAAKAKAGGTKAPAPSRAGSALEVAARTAAG